MYYSQLAHHTNKDVVGRVNSEGSLHQPQKTEYRPTYSQPLVEATYCYKVDLVIISDGTGTDREMKGEGRTKPGPARNRDGK